MKLLQVVTCLLTVGTFSFAAEMDSMREDPALVQSALNDMMSQANGNLAQAERHHKHAVNRGRKAVKKQFAEDVTIYGNMVGDYVSQLEKAETELQAVVNDTKAAMAEEAKLSQKNTDWQDPSLVETAKLSAQLGSAERTLKKMQHRRERARRTAEKQVESPMEDEASDLGMKLGDLTEFLETAETNFDSQVSARIANATKTAAKLKADNKTVEKDAVARIQHLEKSLGEQTKKSQSEVTAANKNISLLIAKESKNLTNNTLKIKQNLEVSSDKELKFVGSLKPPPALLIHKNGTKHNGPKPAAKETTKTKKMPAKVALATKKVAVTASKKANVTAPKNVSAPGNTSAPKKALRH